MAEETQPNRTALIVRYILIGLAFVVVFVATAYLVYRLVRNRPGTPRPTPTPTVVPGQPVSAPVVGGPILPAPALPPRTLQRTLPMELRPVGLTTKIDGMLVAQDGRGNLLFDNLTHEEKFQLERERIQAANRVALAKEQSRRQLEQQRLINQGRRELAEIDRQKRQLEVQLANQQQSPQFQPAIVQPRPVRAIQQSTVEQFSVTQPTYPYRSSTR